MSGETAAKHRHHGSRFLTAVASTDGATQPGCPSVQSVLGTSDVSPMFQLLCCYFSSPLDVSPLLLGFEMNKQES